MKRSLLPVLLLALSSLVLAACGGGESDEDKIVDAITTSALSNDPSSCEAFHTLAFMEQSSDQEGKAAVEECEEEKEDDSDNPDSIEVTDVEVDGSDATANAAVTGSTLDGQTVTIALVEEDGAWKLDQLEGFVDLDRQRLMTSLEEALDEESSVSAGEGECFVEGLEELSDSDLEDVVLGGPEGFAELAEYCEGA